VGVTEICTENTRLELNVHQVYHVMLRQMKHHEVSRPLNRLNTQINARYQTKMISAQLMLSEDRLVYMYMAIYYTRCPSKLYIRNYKIEALLLPNTGKNIRGSRHINMGLGKKLIFVYSSDIMSCAFYCH